MQPRKRVQQIAAFLRRNEPRILLFFWLAFLPVAVFYPKPFYAGWEHLDSAKRMDTLHLPMMATAWIFLSLVRLSHRRTAATRTEDPAQR